MKKVILGVFIVFTSFIYCKGQDTVFTQQEVLRIYEVVDSLESENDFLKRQSDLNFRLIKQYEISNKELEDLLSYNERYIAIRNAELETMEQSIVNLQKYIQATKRPFWDKPLIWVLVGASTIYASSLIVSNIR